MYCIQHILYTGALSCVYLFLIIIDSDVTKKDREKWKEKFIIYQNERNERKKKKLCVFNEENKIIEMNKKQIYIYLPNTIQHRNRMGENFLFYTTNKKNEFY